MLFDSPLQLLVLCAVAIGGWLLGFATNPTTANSDRTMRRLNRDFAAFRTQAQARLSTLTRHAATLEAAHQAMTERLSDAEARIATFKAAVAAPEPVGQPVEAEAETEAEALVPPLTAGESAAPPPDAVALADLGDGDALTRINGIDPAIAQRLSELGISRFEDIETLSDQDEMALELRLALPAGYITGWQWRQQAAGLRSAAQ